MKLIYENFSDGTPALMRDTTRRGLVKGNEIASGRALRRAHERDQRRIAKAAGKPLAIFAHPLFEAPKKRAQTTPTPNITESTK